MEEIPEKIINIEQAIAEAFNRRDLDAILQYFDENLVLFSSTKHERLHGKDALRNTFAYYLEQAQVMDFELDEIEVHIFEPVAVSTFYWSIYLESDGREQEIAGRGSHVFVQRNGDWKIVHEHFSRAQHPPELWDTSPGQ